MGQPLFENSDFKQKILTFWGLAVKFAPFLWAVSSIGRATDS